MRPSPRHPGTVYLPFPHFFELAALGFGFLLDEEFKKQRARIVRDLAAKAADPFIKSRLLDVASRYEDDGPKNAPTQTPLDLQFQSRGTGPERRSVVDRGCMHGSSC